MTGFFYITFILLLVYYDFLKLAFTVLHSLQCSHKILIIIHIAIPLTSVYSPRMSRSKHHQDGQNSGRLSPSGSLTSGGNKSRTLPGVPGGNQTSGKDVLFLTSG